MSEVKIRGVLERIIFQSEETGFTVAKIKEPRKKELTSVVGNLIGVSPGETLELQGRWVHKKSYGEQFEVREYRTIIPATVSGIEKYLGSGLIKGIGPVTAKRIVSHFGLQTLDIIENSPRRLMEVDGVAEKRISMIQNAWEAQKEIKEVMLFLQSNKVSTSYAIKIYKQYGSGAISVVKNDPYLRLRLPPGGGPHQRPGNGQPHAPGGGGLDTQDAVRHGVHPVLLHAGEPGTACRLGPSRSDSAGRSARTSPFREPSSPATGPSPSWASIPRPTRSSMTT